MVSRITAFMICCLTANLFISCGMNQSPPDELLESISAFYTAIENADEEARIKLLADDIIMMPDHWSIMEGKDVVSHSIQSAGDAIFKLKDRKMIRIEVSGDMAYTVNSYYYTYHAKGQAEQWHKTKNVHIWQRYPTGHWKLKVDIWNSDVPSSQFMKE